MATEYTPTTEDVRRAYWGKVGTTLAEFNRWLAARDAELMAERDAALAVIEKAPHAENCDLRFDFGDGLVHTFEGSKHSTRRIEGCTCWKSTVDTSALAARDAETRRQALEAVTALHQPVILYRHPDIEDDDAEWIRPIERLQELFEREAADEFSGVSGTWDEARLFVTERTYCGHCMKVVEEAVEPYAVPFSPLAQWPCATVRALAEKGTDHD